MHHWRSSPSRTWPERKWQRFVHNHNIHPLEQTQYGGIMLTEFKIHFTFTLNSGSRSSLTISQIQFSSISSSSFSLLRTARARTSSALAGSVCLRWDSSAVVWNKLSSKKKIQSVPFSCSSRDYSAILVTSFFLCCGRTWSAWWLTPMRASSVVSQRSSLDWSEAPSIGATPRYAFIWNSDLIMKLHILRSFGQSLGRASLEKKLEIIQVTEAAFHTSQCEQTSVYTFVMSLTGWQPLAAVVSTASYCPVQYHNRNLCRLGHLHCHSLCKLSLYLYPLCLCFHLLTFCYSFHMTLSRTGEQGPTQASLAVWDANGVSSQWRGGLLRRCLVSRKVAAQSRCWCECLTVRIVLLLLCSRLYVLQGGLAQQEWRVPELLHRLLQYLEPKLTQVYKNVRERIGRWGTFYTPGC